MKVLSLFSLTAILSSTLANTTSKYKNVYGRDLQPCSADGMALTGFTRTGDCANRAEDRGSHHICMNISASSKETNFCSVTGQPDWCSSTMPCHGDQQRNCPVQNWCVCEWAFAKYLKLAGGCDHVQSLIVCESINAEALVAYRSAPDASEALACIEKHCGIAASE
jgi:uncharacterized protein (DUF2237 family)